MERRVEVSEWVEFQLPYLIAFLGGEARLAGLAGETGAFERARKIGSPSDLLRLLLFRVGGGRSFMDTATIAAEAGVADLSDAALVKRFARAADWLGRLLCEAISWNEQQRLPGCVDVVDATTVGRRGAKGTDHRLHLRIDLASNRVVEAELPDAKGGETLDRFAIRAGGVVIADAGYAHRVRWEVSPSVGGTSSSGSGGRTFRWRMRQANRWICWQRSSRCRRPSRPSLRCSFGRRRAAASRPAWWRSARASRPQLRHGSGFASSGARSEGRSTCAPCNSPGSRSF